MSSRPAPKALLFDFDGVLVESADIKTWAFRRLFGARPQAARIVAYHRANAGVSRFRKFDHIYKEILKEPLPAARRRALGAEFSRLVEDRVAAAPLVPGAAAALRRCRGLLDLFVISGTPHRELLRIVRRRKMGRWFRGVFGSPRTKDRLIRLVLRRRRLKPAEAVYVGDAMTDWRAARACGAGFIGRVPRGRRSPFPRGTAVVRDLRGLAARVGLR